MRPTGLRRLVTLATSAWLFCITAVATAQPNDAQPLQSVVVRVPASENAMLAETTVRMMAELRAAGFVPVLEQHPEEQSQTNQPTSNERQPIATIALRAANETQPPRAEVWVAGRRGGTTDASGGRDEGASTLAIRTIELLRANLPEGYQLRQDRQRAQRATSAKTHSVESKMEALPSTGDSHSDTLDATEAFFTGRSSDKSETNQDVPAVLSLGVSGSMYTGDWPATWAINLRGSFPIAPVWSLTVDVSATPHWADVPMPEGSGELTQQMATLGASYSPIGRDSLFAPSASLDVGVRHARVKRYPIELGSWHIWSLVFGPSVNLRAQITTEFALYANAGAMLTVAPRQFNEGGFVMGQLGAGAAAMF